MPAEGMRAELSRLNDVSQETIANAEEIDESLKRIGSRVDDLRGSWTGPAASAYLTVWGELHDECVDMIADLRWIGESLSSTAKAYGHTDGSSAEALESGGL